MNVFFKPGTNIVDQAFMAFGGMAATTTLAQKTCAAIVGK